MYNEKKERSEQTGKLMYFIVQDSNSIQISKPERQNRKINV